MQGIFQKENTDKALKYGIYRHLPTYEKIIRNLVSFYYKKKKLSFTRQEFCNAHQLGAGKSFRICLAKDCIIGAGSLVTKNTVIPDGSLVMGSPARIKRNLTWEEYSENIVALEKIHSNPIK